MKTGLALSGGAVRGMAHIGVLKYLEEQEIKVDMVAGTSAGSLVGALFAAGKNAAEIQRIALDIHWRDILKYIYSVSFPRKGLINIEFLNKILQKHLGEPTFEELQIPLVVVVVDLLQNRAVHIDSGDVASAVMASCAIPGIFTPVQREGHTLVDGGVLQNIPTAPLVAAGVKNIIAVNLNARMLPDDPPHNVFDILYRTIYLMARDKDKKDGQQATFLIEPELERFGLWELDKAEEMMELGYREAQKVLEGARLKRTLWDRILSR